MPPLTNLRQEITRLKIVDDHCFSDRSLACSSGYLLEILIGT
jgi:hypothetical protein